MKRASLLAAACVAAALTLTGCIPFGRPAPAPQPPTTTATPVPAPAPTPERSTTSTSVPAPAPEQSTTSAPAPAPASSALGEVFADATTVVSQGVSFALPKVFKETSTKKNSGGEYLSWTYTGKSEAIMIGFVTGKGVSMEQAQKTFTGAIGTTTESEATVTGADKAKKLTIDKKGVALIAQRGDVVAVMIVGCTKYASCSDPAINTVLSSLQFN